MDFFSSQSVCSYPKPQVDVGLFVGLTQFLFLLFPNRKSRLYPRKLFHWYFSEICFHYLAAKGRTQCHSHSSIPGIHWRGILRFFTGYSWTNTQNCNQGLTPQHSCSQSSQVFWDFCFFKAFRSFRLWYRAIYVYCNYSWLAIHGHFYQWWGLCRVPGTFSF